MNPDLVHIFVVGLLTTLGASIFFTLGMLIGYRMGQNDQKNDRGY